LLRETIRRPGGRSGGPLFLARFSTGTLTLTEAGTRRRASIHLVAGSGALASLDPGGLELFGCSVEEFTARLRSVNHTVKRALTDPRLFSGIGNAYSDEILHAARMSPFLQTARMSDEEAGRLFDASRSVLTLWRERLESEREGRFPRKVTAFHEGMAVHGRFGKPCPVCGTPVQRIRYADNESNYCPLCQTGGTVYADRALSRLLKGDWPRTVEELENLEHHRR
ncbi:zinc finger domain-containing protein, partial [Salinispira pacifica]